MSNTPSVRRPPPAHTLISWGALSLLSACGSEPAASPRPDAATGVDVVPEASADAPASDVVSDEGPADVPSDLDVPGPEVTDPCAADAVVDLDRRGTRTGARIVYVGSTASGPAASVWSPSMTCLVAGRAIRPVAHRYVARAAVNLRITTALGTDTEHDTVIWSARTCSLMTGAIRACNDDSLGGAQSRVQVIQVPVGLTVIIAVATVAMRDGEPGRPYQLTIDEFPTPAEGERCTDAAIHSCVVGSSCAEPGDSATGVCRADGTSPGARCRTTGAACDDGLACVGTTCLAVASAGDACRSGVSTCGALRCINVDATDPRSGVCTAPGEPGGACAPVGCSDGLRCSIPVPTTASPGVCRRHAAVGEECDPLGARAVCDAPDECAPDLSSPARFRCVAPGTAAGARCREGGGCDADLRCSAAGGLGFCRAPTTGACAPSLAASDCGVGRTCAASSLLSGRCVAWARESIGDNDVGSAEAPRAMPIAVRGALLPVGDVDCFRVDLGRDGPLVFRVHDGTGRCLAGALPVVQVLDADSIEGSFTYPGCTPTSGTAGARLPAGRYTVCVSSPGGPVLDYFLTLDAP